ncbi:MAG: hypothetical protein A4E65_02766 [Syntrophorhabdus sp. PtaU1.Bin153]|nr:MAG: hypothetical protein A4E65_02766 [Syntrophorhabdus sp. PtaU1.Bin153]
MKTEESTPAPRPMDIGIGIHFGRVAAVSCLEQPPAGRPESVICEIEGFAINYAKRVESSSRMGKFSKIFLSREAARLLDGDPVVLSQVIVPLKGIHDSEIVFEVNSALFEDMPKNSNGKYYEDFITRYADKIKNLDITRDSWMKGLIISTIDSRMRAAASDSLRLEYAKKVANFIWQDIAEDDPIILFARARACGVEKKHTQKLTYLKALVDKYPTFVQARKKLAEVCWQISEADSERAELVIARDTIEEFLNRFPQYLSDAEKDHFLTIIDKIAHK